MSHFSYCCYLDVL